MNEDYFYIGEVKIFPEQVNDYLKTKHIIEQFGDSFAAAFEDEKFWGSSAERIDFLKYLGFSEDGVNYYLENELEHEVIYDIYTILSQTELYNTIKSKVKQ